MNTFSEDMGENIDGDLSRALELQQQHKTCAEEAFTYLLDYFGIQVNTQEFRIFRVSTGRGIVALAYILRRRLRALFLESRLNPSDANEFSRFARNFEVLRDRCYFFRVLKRIVQIFELTVYCLNEGHDHIETARGIVSLDENYNYFEAHGGVSRLNATCMYMSNVYDVLEVVIRRESPRLRDLESFVESVESLEQDQFGLLPMRGQFPNLLKRNLESVTGYITGDPLSSKVFHHTVCQHSSKMLDLSPRPPNEQDQLEEDIRSEKEAVLNSFQSTLKIVLGEFENSYWTPAVNLMLTGCFATFRHLTDVMSTELDLSRVSVKSRTPQRAAENFRSSDEYFIISGEYVARRRRQKMSRRLTRSSFGRSDLLRPSVKNIFFKNLESVINTNIDHNNYFWLRSGKCVVFTQGCKFGDSTFTVVVSR